MARLSVVRIVVLVGFGLLEAGCETKAQSGALIGGASGAGLGAIIGHQSGHTGHGALIGGAIGTAGGYLVGNELDKEDDRAQMRSGRPYYGSSYNEGPRPEAQPRPVSKADVIAWTRRGERDEVIIDRIQRSGTVFRFRAADENELRDAGVGEDVIRAMKNTGR